MASYAFTYPSHVPSWLMTLLSVNTVLMISMHCFAFMIGTCLIPYMHATSKEYHSPEESIDGHLEMVPNFSPHLRFRGFIRVSHHISHVVGLFVFLVEIVLIAWVKFWDVSLKACVASTLIMLPFMVAFVFFWWYFNFSYKTQIYTHRVKVIENVQMMYNQAHQNVAFEECRRHSESIPRRRKSLGSHSSISVHF
jgi:Mediator of CRAC channel activity